MTVSYMKIALGLGSNLGDRKSYILSAIDEMVRVKLISDVNVSSFYDNKALLIPHSPKEWDMNYLNCVISGYTNISPRDMLLRIKEIEKKLGRKPSTKWAPRPIDIDILMYDNICIDDGENEDSIVIPHAHLIERDFAICLLAEIEPLWKYPGSGKFKGNSISFIATQVHGKRKATQ